MKKMVENFLDVLRKGADWNKKKDEFWEGHIQDSIVEKEEGFEITRVAGIALYERKSDIEAAKSGNRIIIEGISPDHK